MFGFSGNKLTRLYGWCEDTLWKAQSVQELQQANDTKTSIHIAFFEHSVTQIELQCSDNKYVTASMHALMQIR